MARKESEYRRALVIGCNYPGTSYALAGCVNDALNMANYLDRRKYNVHLLTDRDATRSNILLAADGLVREAPEYGRLVLYASGHGTNVRDLDGDEADGRDEAYCPNDFMSGGYIIDDDWRAIFNKLGRYVSLTAIFDCCYSGTTTRMIAPSLHGRRDDDGSGRFARYIPPSRQHDEQHRTFRERLGEVMIRDINPNLDVTRNRPVVTEESLRWATLSACLPHEVAYESDGQGDLTRNLLHVLNNAKNLGATLTHTGLMKRLIDAFGEDRWQTPHLDIHPKDSYRVLFGIRR